MKTADLMVTPAMKKLWLYLQAMIQTNDVFTVITGVMFGAPSRAAISVTLL